MEVQTTIYRIQLAIFIVLMLTLIYNMFFYSPKMNEPKVKKYLSSSHSGLVRGFLIGMLTGNPAVAIQNGATFAIINPSVSYLGY